MLLLRLLCCLFYFPIVFSLNEATLQFSVDYFKSRNLRFVCLLLCQDDSYPTFFRLDGFHEFFQCLAHRAGHKEKNVGESIFTSHSFNQIEKVLRIDGSLKFTKLSAKFSMVTSKGVATNYESINSCLRHRFNSVGVLVDIECPGLQEILNYASINMLFDSVHKWLIVDEGFFWGSAEKYGTMNLSNESFNGTVNGTFNGANTFMAHENIGAVFNYSGQNVDGWAKLNLSVDADIIWAVQKDETSYSLVEVFNFGKAQGGELVFNEIAVWDGQRGSKDIAKLNEYKYYRRWDFRQWVMRMVIVMSDPLKVFDESMLLGEQHYPGLRDFTTVPAIVLNILAEIHNFRFKYTVADRWIGEFNKNSNTVSSSIYHKDQDISVAIRFIKIVHDKIDLLHPPLSAIETRYYYRIPTNGPGKLENQFLRPLTPGAWVCVLTLIGLCALVLMASAYVEQRPSSAQYAVFSVIASFCQQFFEDASGSGTDRKSTARKLTIFVTGLSCMLIFNYYTSSVVSWLLNGPPPSINSLQELLESPLELVLEDVGYSRSWLQSPFYYFNKRFAKMEDELRKRKIFNKKKGSHLLMSVEDGIELVKAGGYAFHTETAAANRLISKSFTQRELCELGSLQSMEATKLYPCVQKNSPYKEFFVWSLMRLKERGLVSCIQRRSSFAKVDCAGVSPRALALGGAAPVFLLLAFGYVLATIIMVFERISARRQNIGVQNI